MDLYIREKYLKKVRGFNYYTDIIKVFTGIRRSGKSCMMETIRNELLCAGVSGENILFIDLDSRKYHKIKTPDQLEGLIDPFSASDGIKYLFTD